MSQREAHKGWFATPEDLQRKIVSKDPLSDFPPEALAQVEQLKMTVEERPKLWSDFLPYFGPAKKQLLLNQHLISQGLVLRTTRAYAPQTRRSQRAVYVEPVDRIDKK